MSDNPNDYSEASRRYDADSADFRRLVSSYRRDRFRRNRLPSPSSPVSPNMSADSQQVGPPLTKRLPENSSCGDDSSSYDDDSGIRKEYNDIVGRRSVACPPVRNRDDKIIIQSKGESRYALLPDKRLRRYWDSYIFVLVIYVAFVSVFVYSFLGVLGVDSPWFWMERFLDVSFAIDIVVSFFAAYEKDGFWVKDLSQIRRRYLRGSFIFDVLATIPWDTIALITNNADKSKPHILQLPRFIRLVRLSKLFRLVKIFQLQQKFTWVEIKLRLKYGHLRLVGLIGTVIFAAHFFGCLFYYFGTIGNPGPNESWTMLTGPGDQLPGDVYGKYMSALYFSVYTITTIGYGDIVPVSTLERTYTTVVMLLGAACFAYVISQVSDISSELNASSVHNRVLMDSITDLQKSRNLRDDLVFDIRRFFKREHLRQRVVTEGKLLDGMSRDLRVKVLKHIYGPHLQASRLLRGVPEGHKEDVYVHAKEIYARKGEILFKQGDRADCFYVIIRGSVEVTLHESSETIDLEDDSIFGEADVLFNRPRKEDAVCTSYTDLVKVPRSAVMDALDGHPEALEKLRREEALNLWEEAMWHVEQQIRYNRMAHSLRQKGEQYLLEKNGGVPLQQRASGFSKKATGTRSKAVSQEKASKDEVLKSRDRTGPSQGRAKTVAEQGGDEKKIRIAEKLREQIRSVQQQLAEMTNALDGM